MAIHKALKARIPDMHRYIHTKTKLPNYKILPIVGVRILPMIITPTSRERQRLFNSRHTKL